MEKVAKQNDTNMITLFSRRRRQNRRRARTLLGSRPPLLHRGGKLPAGSRDAVPACSVQSLRACAGERAGCLGESSTRTFHSARTGKSSLKKFLVTTSRLCQVKVRV